MEGNVRENLTFTQNVKKRGYETVIPLRFNGNFLVANALAADGTVLATTDVWDLALGATVSICSLFLSLQYLIGDFSCWDISTYVFTLLLKARSWSCRLLQDRLRPSRRFRSHACAPHSLLCGASRRHVGSPEEDFVRRPLVVLRSFIIATSHSVWGLQRLFHSYASVYETFPVFEDLHWRLGKTKGKNHAEICHKTFAYPPSIKRTGVQDSWGAFGEMCTAWAEEIPPSTAHTIILLFPCSYYNRGLSNSACSVQGILPRYLTACIRGRLQPRCTDVPPSNN